MKKTGNLLALKCVVCGVTLLPGARIFGLFTIEAEGVVTWDDEENEGPLCEKHSLAFDSSGGDHAS